MKQLLISPELSSLVLTIHLLVKKKPGIDHLHISDFIIKSYVFLCFCRSYFPLMWTEVFISMQSQTKITYFFSKSVQNLNIVTTFQKITLKFFVVSIALTWNGSHFVLHKGNNSYKKHIILESNWECVQMIYSLQTNTIIKLSHQFLTVTINYKIKKNQYKLPMLQDQVLRRRLIHFLQTL